MTVAPAAEIPFSQAWLYEFYRMFEKTLTKSQKSILNAVIAGMGRPEQGIRDSDASPKQIAAAIRIINTTIKRCRK